MGLKTIFNKKNIVNISHFTVKSKKKHCLNYKYFYKSTTFVKNSYILQFFFSRLNIKIKKINRLVFFKNCFVIKTLNSRYYYFNKSVLLFYCLRNNNKKFYIGFLVTNKLLLKKVLLDIRHTIFNTSKINKQIPLQQEIINDDPMYEQSTVDYAAEYNLQSVIEFFKSQFNLKNIRLNKSLILKKQKNIKKKYLIDSEEDMLSSEDTESSSTISEQFADNSNKESLQAQLQQNIEQYRKKQSYLKQKLTKNSYDRQYEEDLLEEKFLEKQKQIKDQITKLVESKKKIENSKKTAQLLKSLKKLVKMQVNPQVKSLVPIDKFLISDDTTTSTTESSNLENETNLLEQTNQPKTVLPVVITSAKLVQPFKDIKNKNISSSYDAEYGIKKEYRQEQKANNLKKQIFKKLRQDPLEHKQKTPSSFTTKENSWRNYTEFSQYLKSADLTEEMLLNKVKNSPLFKKNFKNFLKNYSIEAQTTATTNIKDFWLLYVKAILGLSDLFYSTSDDEIKNSIDSEHIIETTGLIDKTNLKTFIVLSKTAKLIHKIEVLTTAEAFVFSSDDENMFTAVSSRPVHKLNNILLRQQYLPYWINQKMTAKYWFSDLEQLLFFNKKGFTVVQQNFYYYLANNLLDNTNVQYRETFQFDKWSIWYFFEYSCCYKFENVFFLNDFFLLNEFFLLHTSIVLSDSTIETTKINTINTWDEWYWVASVPDSLNLDNFVLDFSDEKNYTYGLVETQQNIDNQLDEKTYIDNLHLYPTNYFALNKNRSMGYEYLSSLLKYNINHKNKFIIFTLHSTPLTSFKLGTLYFENDYQKKSSIVYFIANQYKELVMFLLTIGQLFNFNDERFHLPYKSFTIKNTIYYFPVNSHIIEILKNHVGTITLNWDLTTINTPNLSFEYLLPESLVYNTFTTHDLNKFTFVQNLSNRLYIRYINLKKKFAKQLYEELIIFCYNYKPVYWTFDESNFIDSKISIIIDNNVLLTQLFQQDLEFSCLFFWNQNVCFVDGFVDLTSWEDYTCLVYKILDVFKKAPLKVIDTTNVEHMTIDISDINWDKIDPLYFYQVTKNSILFNKNLPYILYAVEFYI